MYSGCFYQRLHNLHANQARITHYSKGLHVKGWLIANWVAMSEAGAANENSNAGASVPVKCLRLPGVMPLSRNTLSPQKDVVGLQLTQLCLHNPIIT